MSKIETGGHAFPTIYPELASTEEGMTLRDFFASTYNRIGVSGLGMKQDAKDAYAWADALLAARAAGDADE